MIRRKPDRSGILPHRMATRFGKFRWLVFGDEELGDRAFAKIISRRIPSYSEHADEAPRMGDIRALLHE